MEPATDQHPTAVPTLDDIARDPRCAARLERPVLSALLLRSSVVQSAIVAQLTAIETNEHPARPAQGDDDAMLTVDEAAQKLRKSRQWIYRRAKSLPFVRRISRKSLLVSENGLRQWMDDRRKAV